MLINKTKTTIQASKIAISYNNNEEYNAILKIITIFRLMKLNIIFEPIEIAGDNYKKSINCGIDESNLTHLKNTNFFFHTPFNYDNFNNKIQIKANYYLNVAMEYFFTRYYKIVDDNNLISSITNTNYFNEQQEYIKNINDFDIFFDKDNKESMCDDYDFSISFGRKYASFELKNTSDYAIICFICEFLNFVNLQDYGDKIKQFKNIDEVIKYCRKEFFENKNTEIIEIKDSFLSKINNIEYNIENRELHKDIFNKDIELTKKNDEFIKIKIIGKYIISQIVNNIKEKQVPLPEGFELYQIISNDIEFYPNINFWYRDAINPIIILKRVDKY